MTEDENILEDLFELMIQHRLKGNMKQAIEIFRINEAKIYNLKNLRAKFLWVHSLGNELRDIGRFDESLKYLKSAMEIADEGDFMELKALVFEDTGTVYYRIGQYQEAIEEIEKSLEIAFKNNYIHRALISVFELALVAQTLQKPTLVEHHFSEIERRIENLRKYRVNEINSQDSLAGQGKINTLNQCFPLVKALVHKMRKSIKDVAIAQSLLEELLEQENIYYRFELNALYNLCEIYLDEFRLYEKDESFEKAKSVAIRIEKIGEKKKIATAQVEGLLLRTEFDLLEGKISLIDAKLQNARKIAITNGLEYHLEKLKQKEEKIMHSLETWNTLSSEKYSILDRFQRSSISEYIKNAQAMIYNSQGD